MSIMSIGAAGMRAAGAFETAATRITRAGAGLGDAAQPSAEIDMATEMVSMMLSFTVQGIGQDRGSRPRYEPDRARYPSLTRRSQSGNHSEASSS